MSAAIKKFFSDYGILIIVVIGLMFLFWPSLTGYFASKSRPGRESMDQTDNAAYSGAQQPRGGVLPSEPLGQNEVYSSVSGQSDHPCLIMLHKALPIFYQRTLTDNGHSLTRLEKETFPILIY